MVFKVGHFDLQIYADQIIGTRPSQQDSFGHLSTDKALLCVVADGMGGHYGGEKASQILVDSFIGLFKASKNWSVDLLSQALDHGNQAIKEFAQNHQDYKEMGTTLIATLVINNELYWISVGDSPLWLYRNQQLIRLNQDHSMLPVLLKMVEMGDLELEEAYNDPQRHVLRSVITGEAIKKIDQNEDAFLVQEGDRLILASDGVETLSENQITELLANHKKGNNQAMVKELLTQIEKAGQKHQDNASLILVSISNPQVSGDKKSKTKSVNLFEKIKQGLFS